MRIIIVGCGKIGRTIAGQLVEEKHDVTVVDVIASKVEQLANTMDVMGTVGSGASYSTLMDAGIQDADLLIAVTSSDEVNLLCCLFGKKAGHCRTIARVRNPLYRSEINYIKEELALSMVINPEHDAATEIARVLRLPLANKIDTFAKGKVELLRYVIPEDSPLVNKSLMNISSMTKSEVLICAVQRGDEVLIPRGDFVLSAGDTIGIIAKPVAARDFFKRIGHDTHQVKNAMIIGGDRIGYYLAEQLCAMGIDVKIIEMDEDRCQELSEILPKATIICGNAFEREILLEEGLENMDSVVTLLGMDESNMFLSLFAKKCSEKSKIVTKINSSEHDDIIESFNLGSVICPREITANNIVSYVRARQNTVGSNMETLYRILDNKVEALEFKISSASNHTSIPLMQLSIKEGYLIGCINRNGKIMIANGQTTIEPGDTVIIITTRSGLDDIQDVFKN